MYLRMTKRRNADGSEVRYYQLAENEWDTAKGCAVAKVVYNFGRADELDPEKLRRLADSIVRFFPASAVSKPRDDIRILQSWPYGGIYDETSYGIERRISGRVAAGHKIKFLHHARAPYAPGAADKIDS